MCNSVLPSEVRADAEELFKYPNTTVIVYARADRPDMRLGLLVDDFEYLRIAKIGQPMALTNAPNKAWLHHGFAAFHCHSITELEACWAAPVPDEVYAKRQAILTARRARRRKALSTDKT